MAGIYTRDGINYGGLLGSALQNRLSNMQRQAEYERNKGSIWGGFGQRAGNYLGTAINTMGQREFEEQEALRRAQEAALEAERNRQFQEAQQLKQIAANERIAKINARQAEIEKSDEYRLNFQKAKDKYNMYYNILKSMDPAMENAEEPAVRAQYLKAKNDADSAYQDMMYWQKKNGIETGGYPEQAPATEPAQVPADNSQFVSPKVLEKDQMANIRHNFDKGLIKNSSDAKSAREEVEALTFVNASEQKNLISDLSALEQKLAKKESTDRANKKLLDDWKKPGDPLPSGWELRYIEGVKQPAHKVNGNWKGRGK